MSCEIELLFFTASDLSKKSGGSIATREIVKAFAQKQDVTLNVACPKPENSLPTKIQQDVNHFIYMPSKRSPPTILTHGRSAIDGFRGMREALEIGNPQAVVARMHHTLLAPAFFAEKEGLPYLLLARGNSYKRLRFSPVLKRIFRYNVQRADEVYAASGEIKHDADRYRGVKQSESKILANAVDTNLFAPTTQESAREDIGIELEDSDFVVGFVGTMRRMHAVRELVKSLIYVDHTNIKILLVGDGDDRDAVEELVRTQGFTDKVIFTGFISHEKVPKYISACDVCYAAMKRESATPIKCFEYMSCARPIIVNDMEEMLFVNELGLGRTINYVSPEEIGAAIEDLYETEESKMEEMGRLARSYVEENYTWSSFADVILKDISRYTEG